MTTIKLTANVKNKNHVFLMEIFKGRDIIEFMFSGNSLGWLQAQTTIDNFKDSLTECQIADETVDPR